MTDHTKSAGDVEAREAAVKPWWSTLEGSFARQLAIAYADADPHGSFPWYKLNEHGRNSDTARMHAALDRVLTSTKAEPSRIAEIRERHESHQDNYGLGFTATYANNDRAYLLSHITAIEADRDRMREALEWIRDELPDRDDWDNFEEHSALVLRMRAKARAALKSSKPGEG